MSDRRTLMIANAMNGDPLTVPLTFTAAAANSSVTLGKSGSPTVSGLKYRYGTSGEWLPYTIGTTLSLSHIGDTVQFLNTENALSTSASAYVKFSMNGSVAASGNLMSMLNYSDSVPSYAFNCLFLRCSSLTQAPELPATTLGYYCYSSMFSYCSSLTQAPELPATTLGDVCYAGMFRDCFALTQAPELPATTLTDRCYRYMFNGCAKLAKIEVAFTEWTDGSTYGWVSGAAASGTFVKPAALPETFGNDNIPTGWTVVNK